MALVDGKTIKLKHLSLAVEREQILHQQQTHATVIWCQKKPKPMQLISLKRISMRRRHKQNEGLLKRVEFKRIVAMKAILLSLLQAATPP